MINLKSSCIVVVLLGLACVSGGCANTQHQVLAATGTVIGIDISQDPATQAPHAKIGYDRGELAIVPTNRSQCFKKSDTGEWVCTPQQGRGAKDSTDVIMELRFKSGFTFSGDAGVYQRLAVGENAVKQPGAAFMLAKDAAGNLDPATAAAVARVVDPKALAAEQVKAVDKIAAALTVNDKTEEGKLTQFFRCAGYDDQNARRLADRYKGLSTAEFKAAFFKEYGWEATDYETCIR